MAATGEGERLVAEIKEAGGTAEFLAADLSALAEVRRLAEAVQQRTDRLDVLINNAGIGTGGSGAPRQTSADGHELRFAVLRDRWWQVVNVRHLGEEHVQPRGATRAACLLSPANRRRIVVQEPANRESRVTQDRASLGKQLAQGAHLWRQL